MMEYCFNKDGIKSIAVIGPKADSRQAIIGNYEGKHLNITVIDV